MKVAAIYDVHGNLPALEAVLAEVRRVGVDGVVVGGDVLPGPMPRETLDRLLGLDLPVTFVHGNGDRVVLACLEGREIDEVPEGFRDAIEWTAERLRPEHRHALAGWPPTHRMTLPGLGTVLFCHATAHNDTDIFTRATPADRVARIFSGVDADVVVCGHTHMQFDRTVGRLRIVNAGSVGLPFAGPAGAHWLLIERDVDLRRNTYDTRAAAAELRRTGYPRVEDDVIRYVLEPPTEEETLRLFSSAEVGAGERDMDRREGG